jgi:hypothetical protein
MPFMIPVYVYDRFEIRHYDNDENETVPCDTPRDRVSVAIETTPCSWFARLSAPGYLDCTDWLGPFDTIEQSRAAIVEVFNVCPWCGARYEDDEECDCEANEIRKEGPSHA